MLVSPSSRYREVLGPSATDSGKTTSLVPLPRTPAARIRRRAQRSLDRAPRVVREIAEVASGSAVAASIVSVVSLLSLLMFVGGALLFGVGGGVVIGLIGIVISLVMGFWMVDLYSPAQIRRLIRGHLADALPACTSSASPEASDLEARKVIEGFVTWPNELSEPERIEYAGRLAARLLEAGEFQHAYAVMLDAEAASAQSRKKFARLWWLPEFRSETRVAQQLGPDERIVDPELGLTGELMIALFHALGTERFSERRLGSPAPTSELLTLYDVSSSSVEEPSTSVLRCVVELATAPTPEGLERAWTGHRTRLEREARSDAAPTLALLGLRIAARRIPPAREVYEGLASQASSKRRAWVRSLLPDEAPSIDDRYRRGSTD